MSQDPVDVEQLLRKIAETLEEDDLRSVLEVEQEAQALKKLRGPQTKEELWEWFRDEVGIELGRSAVCQGHSSQLDIAWEIYSFAVTRVLLVLCRGGGKTSTMAWIDYCSAKFIPGFESFTIGPGMNQGQRKYDHILRFVVEGGVIGGKPKEGVIRSTTTITEFANGSRIEIALGGGVANANGPRTPRLHRDETELMEDQTYKQAGNIPAGKMSRDGETWIPAQIVDTSTMKWAGGRIDTMIKEYNEAIADGREPRMEVRIACIFEMAQENPACQSVSDEKRRARLVELGRDPNELCDCHRYDSDHWEAEGDEQPKRRWLTEVCSGRFFRSRGYKRHADIVTLFKENDRSTWNAEQECSEPAGDGVYLKAYSQVRHGIKNYDPHPENGLIYQGIDWGTTDEAAVAWFQELSRPVEVETWQGEKRRVLEVGTLVVFAERMIKGKDDYELGLVTKDVESRYTMKHPGWRVHERYPDYAGANGVVTWRDRLGLPTVSRIFKDFYTEVKLVRTRTGGQQFAIDIGACPVFDRSLRGWREVNGREVHDENCFVADTPIMTENGERPIISIKAGERVWTREGLKEVLWSGQTKIDQTIVVELEDGRQLECTQEHRFWTDRGWIQAQDLLSTDTVSVWRSLPSRSNTPERSSSIEDQDSLESSETASSARPTSWDESAARAGLSIVMCGPVSEGRSPKDMKFTMSMLTPATTKPTISSVSVSPNIASSLDTAAIDSSNTLQGSGRSLPKQWLAKKFAKPSRSSGRSGGSIAEKMNTLASAAGRSSSRDQCGLPSSARTTVGPSRDVNQVSTRSSALVDIAQAASSSTSTLAPNTAHVRVRRVLRGNDAKPVYDLHVDECHEFFAHGVVVHNSHMMALFRYVVHNLFVVGNKAARVGALSSMPAAADDHGLRDQQRDTELAQGVKVSYVGGYTGSEDQIFDDVGAAPSPMRQGTHTMGERDSRPVL